MNCQGFADRLDDFLDGALPEEERIAAAAHRNGCPACREAEARLAAVVGRAASLPRRVEPGRDLWPGIAGRIGKRDGLRGVFGGGRPPWPQLGVLAAAAALVVVSSVVAAVLVASRAPSPGLSGATAGAATASLDFAAARGSYVAARAQLVAALAARRGSLSPATVRVVNDNLAIIDTAVREMGEALARDPGNRELPGLLLTAYRQEIEMLQRATRIPARG